MTAQVAIDHLRQTLAHLQQTARELSLAIDDVPDDANEPAIIDGLRVRAADLEGDAAETLSLVHATSIGRCHERFNTLVRRERTELVTAGTLLQIHAVGRERGGSWQRWSSVVQQALERCDESALDTASALLDCWQELI